MCGNLLRLSVPHKATTAGINTKPPMRDRNILRRETGNRAVMRNVIAIGVVLGVMIQTAMITNQPALAVTASTPTATVKATPTAQPQPVPTRKSIKPVPAVALAATVDAPTPDADPMTAIAGPAEFQVFTVRVSYYNPALGGTNCYPTNWIKDNSNPYGGVCRSKLLGAPWSDWVGTGAACPPSIALRQRVHIESLNRTFYCVDRGGAIQDLYDGTKFIDLLLPAAPWWPNAEVITDYLCPSGCLTSKAWIVP